MSVRLEYRLSPDARHATCLTGDGEPGLRLQTWSRPSGREWLPGPSLRSVDHPQMHVMDDGRVLVYDSRDPDPALWLHEPGGTRIRLATPMPTGVRLFRAPRSGRVGLALVPGDDHTEVRQLELTPPGLTARLARIPGVLATGLPLDASGMVLAMEHGEVVNGPTRVLAVDLRDGSWSTLLDVADLSHDNVLLTHPATGLTVFGTDAAGSRKLGWTRLGRARHGRGELRFPAALNPGGEPLRPLAVSPDGRKILLEQVVGVRSRLSLYNVDEDAVTDVPTPPARILPPVRWTADGLSLVVSTPAEPARLVTIAAPDTSAFRLPDLPKARRAGIPVHVEELTGPASPIEAIVYGGTDWRQAERLVVAIHGGPLSAWRYQHTPLLHRLAEAGVAVVAPNQRGSTGYGGEHALAIRGAWGGPDLADILHIARELHQERAGRELLLFGESYGAFLALLAAGTAPELWSHCAVLSPFMSARSLYRDASRGIRDLIDRLDGRADSPGDDGPCDVLARCHRIRAELFVAHGAEDVMVPVGQSRLLRTRLRELGREPRYLELTDGTHELTTDPHGPVASAVTEFLTMGGGEIR